MFILMVCNQHKSSFFRPSDSRTFTFLVDEYEPSAWTGLGQSFQFAVLLFDSQTSLADEEYKILKRLAPQIEQQGLSRNLICFVGTKIDLVSADLSERDLQARRFQSYLPFFGGHHYLSVSSYTGLGIENLCFHIGEYR